MRVALAVGARSLDWQIDPWIDERALKRVQMKDYLTIKGPKGGTQRAAVVPDGYFVLRAGERASHNFLEIDKRTVTGEATDWGRRDWARKVRAYLAYYRSGKDQERYHTKSLRILTVTTGEGRLKHLKAITEKVGGKARFWFTTFDQIAPTTVLTTPIWHVAGKEGVYSLTW